MLAVMSAMLRVSFLGTRKRYGEGLNAVYPRSAAVGTVTLIIAGCSIPSTFNGSFTITTGVGTLSGSATG
jgi:hypothetical protein